MKKLFWLALSFPLVCMVALFGLLVLGTAKPPRAAPAITRAFAAIDTTSLPAIQHYSARDGAQLSFRSYPAGSNQIAVLLHGSAGSSVDMHPLATALQQEGTTALVPDLRGHGRNKPHGDIAYIGQLEDDLTDFIAGRKVIYNNATWTALGFSSGAAFALRVAGSSRDHLFDRYVLVSPYLRYNAPSVRTASPGPAPEASGLGSSATSSWAIASIGRIVALTTLNRLGVHRWDYLPVVAFPVPPNVDFATQTYSWRLQQNFGAQHDYLGDIGRSTRALQVFVGENDELLHADKLGDEFQSQRSDIAVTILPGLGHSDMVTNQASIASLVAAFH